MSCAEVVELNEEDNVLHGETSFRLQLRLEKGSSPMYVEEVPSAPKAVEVSSKK